jgi:glycosyltransferase involved in cell wall biosynthesis
MDYASMVFTHMLEIRRQLDEFKPDIIIAFGLLNADVAVRFAKRRKIPFVYYVIDELHRLVPEGYLQPLADIVERSNMRRANLVISINESLRDYTIEMGAAQSKTRVIRAGVDARTFSNQGARRQTREMLGLSDKDTVLLFMGWLYLFSGLKEIATEIVRRPDVYSGLRLLIIGRGDLWNELDKISDQPGARDRITLLDWQQYDKIPDYIAASDICLLPALKNEIMANIVPIKMYEYMAGGKPVIAARLKGLVKEFGENAGVVFVDSPKEALEKAADIVRKGEAVELGKRARAFVEPNDWSILVDKFEDEISQIVGE